MAVERVSLAGHIAMVVAMVAGRGCRGLVAVGPVHGGRVLVRAASGGGAGWQAHHAALAAAMAWMTAVPGHHGHGTGGAAAFVAGYAAAASLVWLVVAVRWGRPAALAHAAMAAAMTVMSADQPSGYAPFSGPQWEPLAEH
ncbi:hypothetical protein ACTMTJ_41720 [Phytohabitans sp. LJ34]|uniref:hypothetical protein n=1 Tax=Phytohabitans sp. LJ34 TaxID=3452217 RepID=UPI003F889877